ncbi:Alpha/Beta hydrolase protein [Ilyonectria destructans]|nr:Alpha/Beta hydrolase protein [Ilyonectria destructans]
MFPSAVKTLSSLWLLLAASVDAASLPNQAEYPGLDFYFPKTTSPQPFNIRLDKDFVKLVERKVRDYRPSISVDDDWTVRGPPGEAVADLARYWDKKYDWNTVEKRLNKELKHFAITLPGNGNYTAPIPLHFVHEKSPDKNAIPLLLLHGWSSTHYEWVQTIKPLTRDKGKQNFHIVAPDLPGFGFSPAATQPGMGPKEMGRAFDALMKQLGYTTYGLVSTDIGWTIGMWMTEVAKDSISAHFTDFFLVSPTAEDLVRQERSETTEEENAFIAGSAAFGSRHYGYGIIQTQKPQQISLPLVDSPVGLASWLWDLKEGSSAGYQYTYEELITDTMLNYAQPITGAIRVYSDLLQPEFTQYPNTGVQTGVTQWGNLGGPWPELNKQALAPREWVERGANVVYFNRHASGGHYPAISETKLWVDDVRAFFSGL